MRKILLILALIPVVLLGQTKESKYSPYPGSTFFDGFQDSINTARLLGVPTSVTYSSGMAVFNGSTSKITYPYVGNVMSIRIKVLSLATTTQSLLNLTATQNLKVVSGTITATGFTGAIIYNNGEVSSTATTGRSDIVVTVTSYINAKALVAGLIGASYLNGRLESIELYDRILSPQEVYALYAGIQWYRPPVPDVNHSYGVKWSNTASASEVTRIGNLTKHRTLPIQSKMRACILNDRGRVVYYLNPADWSLKSTGGVSKLDGTDGQVMIEVPQFWWDWVNWGDSTKLLISDVPLIGYTRSPQFFISAYEATVNVTGTKKLFSIVNASAEYIGGPGTTAKDNQGGLGYSALQKARTDISRTNFRTYALNRGPSYGILSADQWQAIIYLYTVEYANRNSQAAVNLNLTAGGYRQGGLGVGVSTAVSAEWNTYNGYYPFINIGASNSLASGTGEVSVTITNFKGAGVNQSFTVPRYRGIENPFGHIWKWIDGVNIYHQSVGDGGKSRIYQKIGAPYTDGTATNYFDAGYLPVTSNYVKTFQRSGLFMPATIGAGATTWWADYFYTPQPVATSGWYAPLVGGYASFGSPAGLVYVASYTAASYSATNFGSRLCCSGL